MSCKTYDFRKLRMNQSSSW